MTAKQRIKQLEKTRTAKDGTPEKIIVMYDADAGGLVKFDSVQMTQAEAEAKAAAQPDNFLIMRVRYASHAIKDGIQ